MVSKSKFSIPLVFGLFLVFTWVVAHRLYWAENESQLIKNVESTLQDLGHSAVKVTFQGSSGVLWGKVESEDEKRQVTSVVRKMQGVTAVDAEDLVVGSSQAEVK